MATRPGIESYAVAVMSMFAGGFARYADTHSGEATYRQWFLLTMLANMGEGPHSVRDLADFAGTTRQNAKRMLEPLESLEEPESDDPELENELRAAMSRHAEKAIDLTDRMLGGRRTVSNR